MRILIINRFFWPDESSTAMLASDLAEDLAAAGHDVHVACARLLYDKPKTSLKAIENWRDVEIHRLPSTRFGRGRLVGRFCDLVTFHASLLFLGPRFNPEVVLVMTDPAMVLLDALWIARLRKARVLHYVMDLYPDIATALGTLRKASLSERVLNSIMTALLTRCDKVIALGGSMATRLTQKGVHPNRIDIVPPWCNEMAITKEQTENCFRAELGLGPGDFLIMYSGNMGRAHPFDAVVEAATLLKDDPHVHFVFIGGGARTEEIRQAGIEKGLKRWRILPYQPRERLPETLSSADAHLITQDTATIGLIVPSKLAGILAAGRPVLHIGDEKSEIGHAIATYQCGISFDPGEGAKLAETILMLRRDSSLLHQWSAAARNAFSGHYERNICTTAVRHVLESLAETRR